MSKLDINSEIKNFLLDLCNILTDYYKTLNGENNNKNLWRRVEYEINEIIYELFNVEKYNQLRRLYSTIDIYCIEVNNNIETNPNSIKFSINLKFKVLFNNIDFVVSGRVRDSGVFEVKFWKVF